MCSVSGVNILVLVGFLSGISFTLVAAHWHANISSSTRKRETKWRVCLWFVLGLESRPYSEGFSSGSSVFLPPCPKINISKFQFDREWFVSRMTVFESLKYATQKCGKKWLDLWLFKADKSQGSSIASAIVLLTKSCIYTEILPL